MTAPSEPWKARYNEFRVLRVLRTAAITPLLRRITLGGAEVAGLRNGPNVKILVPPAGLAEPEWPMLGPDGRPVWPAPEKRPAVRTYSVRRFDSALGELDIDFLLHGEGVAGAWAVSAVPGSLLGVGQPGGLTVREADWYVLAGDQSALPAISRILEELPSTATGWAFIEVADAAERQSLITQSQIQVVWLDRGGAPPGTTRLLEDAVREIEWPKAGTTYAWIAGESSAVRVIRTHLRSAHGLDFQRCLAFGYWKRGMTETTYHSVHDNDRDEDYHRARAAAV